MTQVVSLFRTRIEVVLTEDGARLVHAKTDSLPYAAGEVYPTTIEGLIKIFGGEPNGPSLYFKDNITIKN